jgi:DUF971 family protein
MPYQNQIPTDIKLHSKSRLLDITFDDGVSFSLSCEFLRVNSPSAQVRGHGPGQEVLQLNKELVNITAIEPVGMYAVKLVFDDGHDSGLYNWEYLYELGEGQDEKWQDYLQRLSQAGHQRKAD